MFGKEIENVLNDLNATALYCEAVENYDKRGQELPDKNQSWKVICSSDDPFTFRGMKVDYAHGSISVLMD